MNTRFAMLANAYHSISFDDIEFIEKGLFCIDEEGNIEKVLRHTDLDYNNAIEAYKAEGKLTALSDDQLIIPGFIDLHIHASQWPQAGTALDRPLEVWLSEYTFPLEAKFRDMDFAREVYSDVVSTTLAGGTTTAVYFATVDKEPSVELAKICAKMGQRGFVGKVVMDDPVANPEYCRDKTPELAVQATEEFINEVEAIKDSCRQKVYPVITPRFIPSCTDECLDKLGQLAREKQIHIQTHCSESDWEHGYAKERYGKNDARALSDFGFMGDKTILAHAPFLEEEDVELVSESGASIAHCPLSNAYFAGAVLPLREFHSKGINIGLASDISGGYYPDIYSAIRQAVISSRMLADGVNPALSRAERGRAESAITLNNAFYCATIGGGKAVGLPLGRFEKGYAFDAQVIDTSKRLPLYNKSDKKEDLLHKILLLSNETNIAEVWVQGQRVK